MRSDLPPQASQCAYSGDCVARVRLRNNGGKKKTQQISDLKQGINRFPGALRETSKPSIFMVRFRFRSKEVRKMMIAPKRDWEQNVTATVDLATGGVRTHHKKSEKGEYKHTLPS